MSNNERRPILYNGEAYSQPVIKKSGGQEKSLPMSFDEAKSSMLNQINKTREAIRTIEPDSRLPNEFIISLTMHHDFSAKSYYPDTLFDSDTEKFGLNEIGSRIQKVEEIVDRDGEKALETKSSKMFFLRATEKSLDNLERKLKSLEQTLPKNFQNDIRKISAFGLQEKDDKVMGFQKGWNNGRIEAILHPFDQDYGLAMEFFLEKLDSAGVNLSEIKYKEYPSGVTFISLPGNIEVINEIAGFNPLRAVHPLEMRSLPEISRAYGVNDGPQIPRFTMKSPITVGVIDGGLNLNNPYVKNYVESQISVAGTPLKSYKNHGTQVSGAILYGPLNNYTKTDTLPEPLVSVKNFGVLSDLTDPDLYDAIDAIEKIVPANKDIRVYNLSLGPRGPILDDNINRFTYSCDMLSHEYEVLFCVAVGNDGDVEGYDRIQSPADSVNCLGVGAFTKDDNGIKRAPYSCVGPGREGGKMKPDIMAFGGCSNRPIHLVAEKVGERVLSTGTSFASPIVAGLAGRLVGESNEQITPLAAKALIIQHAEEKEVEHSIEMGHGILPENINVLTACKNDSYTLIYKGEVNEGKYAEFLIPWEIIEKGKATFRWTAAVLTSVDELSPDDYTSSAVEISFYPNGNKYQFTNQNGSLLDGINKKSEVVDILKNPQRAEYLLQNGWKQSQFPKTDSASMKFKTEQELRSDLKWDSLDTREITKLAKGIDDPVFHVHALGRGSRASGSKVKFALVLTVSTTQTEVDLYSKILQKYSALAAVQMKSIVDVRQNVNS